MAAVGNLTIFSRAAVVIIELYKDEWTLRAIHQSKTIYSQLIQTTSNNVTSEGQGKNYVKRGLPATSTIWCLAMS